MRINPSAQLPVSSPSTAGVGLLMLPSASERISQLRSELRSMMETEDPDFCAFLTRVGNQSQLIPVAAEHCTDL